MDQGGVRPARRGRSTAAQVAQMRAAYLAAPRHCLQCGAPILPHRGEKLHETMRRKFCSRSCAASFNNSSAVAPKKKARPRTCASCGLEVAAGGTAGATVGAATSGPVGARLLCAACAERSLYRLPALRRAEASSADLRRHTRHVLAGRPRVCAQCGYARHVEAVHLRPIDAFPPEATLATIDDPANLVYLCPNHRWEYEHGLLTLGPAAGRAARPDPGLPAPLRPPRPRPSSATALASR